MTQPLDPVSESILPPTLQWSPVRSGYPHPTLWTHLRTLTLTGLVAASLGTLGAQLAHQAKRPVRIAHALLLNDDIPVYDVKFAPPSEGNGRPATGDGSGGESGQEAKAGFSAQVTDMAAPTTLAAREPVEADPFSSFEPGAPALPVAALHASGSGKPGAGVGAGPGEGGTGFHRGSKLGLLSADPSKNPVLDLEDMNIVHQEVPEYPIPAVIASICGEVTVQVLISEKGIPLQADVTSSPHRSLTQAVLEATPKWRFKPILVGGVPVRVQVKILYIFTLLQRNGQPKPHWPALPVKRPTESLHMFQELNQNLARFPRPVATVVSFWPTAG